MKKLLVLALALAPLSAHATLIQMDFSGLSFLHPSLTGGEIIYGARLDASFVLDTSDLKSVSYHFGERDGLTCVDAFSAEFAVRSSSLQLDHQEVASGSGLASFRGDGPPPCTGWFSGLGFTIGDITFGMPFDTHGVYTIEQFLASPDPLWDLLQFDKAGLHMSFGDLLAEPDYFAISEVPEPTTWLLLGTGLLGFGFGQRLRRIKR